MQSTAVGPARLRFMEFVLGTLREAGFSEAMTDHAYHAIDSHVTGFTMWQVSMPFATDDEMSAVAMEFLRQLPATYPQVAGHVEQHLRALRGELTPGPTEFEFGLGLILDGLERLRG